jgi:isoleucyl-tRNA synthetase
LSGKVENACQNYHLLKKITASYRVYVKDGTTTGTNIVHLAPVFGEDDYRVCKAQTIITDEQIPYLIPIDDNCNYSYESQAMFITMLKPKKKGEALLKTIKETSWTFTDEQLHDIKPFLDAYKIVENM